MGRAPGPRRRPHLAARDRPAGRGPAPAPVRPGLRLRRRPDGGGPHPPPRVERRGLGLGAAHDRQPRPRRLVPPTGHAATSGSSTTCGPRASAAAAACPTAGSSPPTASTSPPSPRRSSSATSAPTPDRLSRRPDAQPAEARRTEAGVDRVGRPDPARHRVDEPRLARWRARAGRDGSARRRRVELPALVRAGTACHVADPDGLDDPRLIGRGSGARSIGEPADGTLRHQGEVRGLWTGHSAVRGPALPRFGTPRPRPR